ncbi:hypothetical protein [Ancylobacter sp. IITR112]|uniref:hypothetical protein n=1 Tax=Ancylobacter sp. IITR112 TaxID=3138073 RepID=UPI00352A20BE
MGAAAKGFQAAAAGIRAGIAGLTFAAVTASINGSVNALAELDDQAKRSGLSLRSFQEWKFVAESNRIGIDAMVDGFKELNLRADEFITTGGGSAAEAFQRLGFSATDLAERIKDPSEMMLEIIRRLGDIDKAAQIRIFDELLGGSGGEQFVQLITQGERGLRQTIQQAHELGNVLGDDVVKEAANIRKEFDQIANTISINLQGAVVKLVKTLRDMPSAMANAVQVVADAPKSALASLDGEIAGMRKQLTQHEATRNYAIMGDLKNRIVEAERQRDALAELVREGNRSWGSASTMPATAPLPPTKPAEWSPITPPAKGGGGGGSSEQDQAAAQLASRIEGLKMALSTERELELAAHEQRQADLLASFEAGRMAREEYNQWTEREQAAHAERMSAIAENQAAAERQKLQDTFSFTADTFGSLATLAQTFGEKGFAAAKAFGIAEAVINTAVGVTKALELPFPVNMAAAASVAAAGAAQIATIAAARPGGSSRPSVPYTAVANAAPPGSTDNASRAPAYVNITGSKVTWNRDEVIELLGEIQGLIDDGYTLKFS